MIILIETAFAFGQSPVAEFTANKTSGCAPLSVSFTDQSTGNPTSWNWEFSNGTLSSAQNPVVTFSSPGTYSVKLVVQNENGIDDVEKIDYITVFPSPRANFSANLTLGCLPSTVQFTDLSTAAPASIVSWEWDFGDGGTSSQQNPSHTYNNIGFYSVTLSVTNNNGCKSIVSKSSYIRIVDGIATEFSFTQPTTCKAPFVVNFQNQTSGPGNITYNWDFGNSQTSTAASPSAAFNSPGTYMVTLSAQSDLGCTGTIQKPVTITAVTTDFSAPSNTCLNQPVDFQNTASESPVSSIWDFGDGTTSAQINPSKTFLTPGTYTVKLINTYSGCTDSITHTITVNDRPVVDFSLNDSSSCQAPFNVQFNDLTPGATAWLWDFGDGNTSTVQNPTHSYSDTGDFTVSLTVTTSAGCTNTLVRDSLIRIEPVVIQLNVPQGGCAPFTYMPVANILTVDSIATYRWDLGAPGAIFNVKNPPSYTYASPGVYTISLTVTTVGGCTVTATSIGGVIVGDKPLVDFSFNPSDACASDSISFADHSVTTPGAIVTWEWDFGDGGSSHEQNPRHVFMDTGWVTVKLIVSNNRCIDSVKKTIHVIPPVALFTYTFNCATRQVIFRDTSLVDPAITPISYSWDFGNGTTSNLENPSPVTYAPGSYIVTLTVVNGPCSYTNRQTVVIADEPADFSISRDPVCKNEAFTLTAININPDNIDSYSWTIDGAVLSSSSPSVSYSFTNNGSYDVSLTITDINGCKATKTVRNYIVVNGPTARFNSQTPGACLNNAVVFNDLSTPPADIRNWHFDFGDGTQQDFSSKSFSHVYSQLGGFDVSLTVTDQAGCKDSYTLPINIFITNPAAGFRADTFYCPQAPLQFRDTSAGAGLTYQWDFGDGNTSTLQNPQNSYPIGDSAYSVSLVITDIAGCSDTISKFKYIKIRSPKAAFDIKDTSTICPPLRTSFTFQGSDYKSFFWDFGDGGMSTLPNPSYFYSRYGHFTPKLYLTGPGGCIDSAEASVSIYNPATIKINYGPPTFACNNLNVDFKLETPPGFKFIFNFGDGTADSSGNKNFSHFYSRPSLNSPSLTILDTISGCQAIIPGYTRIDVLGAVPLFGKDREEFCDAGIVQFTDFTTKNDPIISTVWDFGDGTTSNDQEPSHNFQQPGLYPVTLNITTEKNCSSSYSDTVYVYRTPSPSIQSRDTICLNVPEPINGAIAQSDTLTNWQWSFGNGQTSPEQNNTVTYNNIGDYTLQLITSNKLGCSDTATKNIYVAMPPTATPVQDPLTIISGGTTTLQMNYTGNIVSYNWVPSTRLSCIDCIAPVANPQFTTTYKVELEDVYGCKNSGNITVTVVCGNANFFIPNTFSPNGDGHNERFFPRGTGLHNVKSMLIFNRWGQVVFEKRDFTVNDPTAGWDGTFKGKKASADVYVYMIEILCDNNEVIPVKGNVTLLR